MDLVTMVDICVVCEEEVDWSEGTTCSVCENIVCDICSNHCLYCGEDLCNSCEHEIWTCKDCGAEYCEGDYEPEHCDKCGDVVCSDCFKEIVKVHSPTNHEMLSVCLACKERFGDFVDKKDVLPQVNPKNYKDLREFQK